MSDTTKDMNPIQQTDTFKCLSPARRAGTHLPPFHAIKFLTSAVGRAAAIALALVVVFSPAGTYAQGVRVVRAHSLPIAPRTALSTTFNVEVNSKGQVVRVKSGKSSKDEMFNAQTYGNVLQMWIRHPDGSATVGLYRVVYAYDPKTKHIGRTIKLLSAGGNWGNAQGAANQMMGLVHQREVRLQQEQDRRDRARRDAAAKLPPLSKIIPPTPTPRP